MRFSTTPAFRAKSYFGPQRTNYYNKSPRRGQWFLSAGFPLRPLFSRHYLETFL